MTKFVAAGIVLGLSLGVQAGRQETALDKKLEQTVTVHFREISVAGAMDFLASHGINVAARTSDVNLRERIALTVTDETMHDVMQAVAEALGARWKRSGNIFVLTHDAPYQGPSTILLSGHRLRGVTAREVGSQWGAGPDEESDPEEAFSAAAETPSAVVNDDGEPEVRTRSVNSTRQTSLLRLTPSGGWAVAQQWHSTSTVAAHVLRPRLSIRQRKLLSKNGSLTASDLTEKQINSLGSVWPDGRYHAISGGHTLLIRP